jgi:hypothetical protein
VLAYNNSVESEIERYREEIRSLGVATLEESNKMAHLGNEMLMQLQFMLDSNPSVACKERGEFLIGQANILSVLGIAGRDTFGRGVSELERSRRTRQFCESPLRQE